MRIFILDDDNERHATFAKNLQGHDVFHARTHDEGLAILNNEERFDLFFLDHDLNDFHIEGNRSVGPSSSMYDSGEKELTGADFAWQVARVLPIDKRPDHVIIHSWNPDGAKNIQVILRNNDISCHYIPFSVDLGKNI